jgi:hypothetical protein
MSKIRNVHHLRSQIKLLKELSAVQEQQIKTDFDAIRESLKPENILWTVISSLFGIRINRNDFFQLGFTTVIGMMVKKFFKKKEKKTEEKSHFFQSLWNGFKDFLN